MNDIELKSDFSNPPDIIVEVEQGESCLTLASKVKEVVSNGVGPCLAVMVRGYNSQKELGIGLFHYEAGRPKKLKSFLNLIKESYSTRVEALVVGGYRSSEDDPDSGSEGDLKEIKTKFKNCDLPPPKEIFNPTDACIDEEVGDHYVDVRIDSRGNFYMLKPTAENWQKV